MIVAIVITIVTICYRESQNLLLGGEMSVLNIRVIYETQAQ
jgi:hypothetical protein